MKKRVIKIGLFTAFALLLVAIVVFTLLNLSSTPEYKQAEAFLKAHIHLHGSVETTLVDNDGRGILFSPYNYTTLYDVLPVLDSLKKEYNILVERKNDSEEVSSDFLKRHILSSLKKKRNLRSLSTLVSRSFVSTCCLIVQARKSLPITWTH